MRSHFTCTLSVLTLFFRPVYTTHIVLTFDDYPMPQTHLFSARERNQRIIDGCSHHNYTTVFFCQGDNIRNAHHGTDNVRMAADRGHFLANHSMTHSSLSSIPLSQFKNEIIATQKLLDPYPTARKWFRYPYLDYGTQRKKGGSLTKAHQSLSILSKLGYAEGYVSINTYDWHINGQLQKALKAHKSINYDALKKVYIELLEEWCKHYIAAYKKFFPKRFTHSLLFHANDLNALYIDDIIAMIERCGWIIVSPELAFNNTGWRKHWINRIFNNPKLMDEKPATLDLKTIDRILADNNVFGLN